MLALAGVPYETARTLRAVSRSYYTELKAPALSLPDALFATRERITGAILIAPEFIRRCATALTCYCRSPIEGIAEFFDRVAGHHVSKGSIGRILRESSEKAETFDRSVALNTVRDVAADEIFRQGKPVLTAADLKTHYVVMTEAAKDRAGETWKAAPEEQKTRGLSPETCVSDGGTGLLKGVPGAFPDIEMRADAFALCGTSDAISEARSAKIPPYSGDWNIRKKNRANRRRKRKRANNTRNF